MICSTCHTLVPEANHRCPTCGTVTRIDDAATQFIETQAMIKFSHSELDRRLRSLEGTVAELELRVERLEGSNRPS